MEAIHAALGKAAGLQGGRHPCQSPLIVDRGRGLRLTAADELHEDDYSNAPLDRGLRMPHALNSPGHRPPAGRFRRAVQFTVDTAGGTVTHHVEGSSNPSWVGSKQLRYFELSSDNAQLTLSLRDGTRTTQSLVWKRSK